MQVLALDDNYLMVEIIIILWFEVRVGCFANDPGDLGFQSQIGVIPKDF